MGISQRTADREKTVSFKRKLKMMSQKLFLMVLTLATVANCINKNPVCGRNGRTYSNEDSARLRFVDIECQGKCPCPKKVDLFPVCGRNGKTYSNEDSARRRFIDIECQGKCPCPKKLDLPPKPSCEDKNDQCEYWTSINECKKNPNYMLVNCPLSCEQCEGERTQRTCEDKNDQCEYWASINECKKNPNYMLFNCAVSCNQCEWYPIVDCRNELNLAIQIEADGSNLRTTAFNPNNDKQLWRQDKDGRIYNKATGKVWVFDKYGSRFEAPGTDFFWDFNSHYENTKVYLEALSDQLGNRCINMGNRFHHQGTNLFLYPCETMYPTNGCFKFKF